MDGLPYSTFEVRVRAVHAVLNGTSITQVAEAYRTHRTTVHRWLKRYRTEGNEAGLQRRPVSGRPRKLQGLSSYNLQRLVLAPASRYGFETDLWTVSRLHQVLTSRFAEVISQDTVWRRLREVGLTWQTPEREYFQVDPRERERWQQETLPLIRQTMRVFRAILYCQDEACVSLAPFLGKTWSVRGQPRKVPVTGKRGSISALSALSPRGHLVFRLHDKRIASGEIIDFLGQLLHHHPKRHLVVIMDQAPPHVSKMTKAYIDSQSRLHVFHLPAYSPDWNPDEKVWNHLKHHELKAHRARTKEELAALTQEKLESMSENTDLLHGLYFRCCVAELLR
jgi:transposase